MPDNLKVVLVRTKYPENVGGVARACLNMGVNQIVLVAPQYFDKDKAYPMATVHAKHLIDGIEIVDTLEEALADVTVALGTTARLGGWRKSILTPDKAGEKVGDVIREGGSAALVMGPEDKGLANEETSICTQLVTIPTAREGTSLNLAQATLILLYECYKACQTNTNAQSEPTSRLVTHDEQETLFATLKETLLAIDYLKKDNPDYWMLPVRRFFQKFNLKRNEFNLLMGVSRQVQWIAGEARKARGEELSGPSGKDDS